MATSLPHPSYRLTPESSHQCLRRDFSSRRAPACRLRLASRSNIVAGYHSTRPNHGGLGSPCNGNRIVKDGFNSFRKRIAGRVPRTAFVVCSAARADDDNDAGSSAELASAAERKAGSQQADFFSAEMRRDEMEGGERQREETGRGGSERGRAGERDGELEEGETEGGMVERERETKYGGWSWGEEEQTAWPVPRVVDSQVILEDFLSVRRDVIALPSGLSSPYLTVFARPLAVAVVAMTVDSKVVVNQEYRHAVGAYVLSLPGGVMDAGETPEQAAMRELEEETGFVGEGAEMIGSCRPLPGVWQQKVLFVRVRINKDERRRATAREGTETLMHTSLVPLHDIDARIKAGVEVDGVLLSGLYFAGLRKG